MDTRSSEAMESTTLLRLVANAVPSLMAYYEADTLQCRFANLQYARSHGHDAHSITGLAMRQVLGDTAWRAIEPQVARCLQGEQVKYLREQALHGGKQRMVEVHLLPHLDSCQTLRGVLVLVNDITGHWQAERAVRLSEERMRKFAEATNEAILFHQDGTVTDGNEAVQRLLGYPLQQLLGQPLLQYVAPRFHALARQHIAQQLEDAYEVAMLHRDGHELPVEVVAKTLQQSGATHRVAILRDLRPHKAAQQRESHLALHDALTQLPNRRQLLEGLDTRLAALQHPAAHPGTQLAVLLLDLDHFKAVNDSLGHAAGDLVLCTVAERMRACVPASDLVARLAGDQFAVVMATPHGRPDAEALADRLLAAVGRRVNVCNTLLSPSPSIGASLYPDDGQDATTLLRHADAALSQAKHNGCGNRQFFHAALACEALPVLQQEQLLRETIAEGSFVLHYQPQVRLSDGALAGLEALVRWQHPERGLVGPAEFIGMAESRGLITPIGRWVLHEVCRQLKAWQDEGLALVPVAVNLSALEFRQRDVVAEISSVLQRTGLAPQWLEIELTESTLMHPSSMAHETLGALKALGVGLAIDDFGTGYSSLAYLKSYPIDKVKIDRSFVTDAPGDADDVAIVTAIVQMAHQLQLQAVAEGVETEAQRQWLTRLGCDLGQGYHIARPLDAGQVRAWLLPVTTLALTSGTPSSTP